MGVIKCKMCGGDLVIEPDSTVAECEFCGTKQTVPTQDNEKKLTLFSRANRLRMNGEFDKAYSVYESIVAEFPEEAEAYWGLILCKYGIEYVDDPATGKKIPTCHRSSFDSVMEDTNLEQAMENADILARRVYREEAKAIEELRKSIIEVSGKEEPYDIFICYKETAEDGDRTIDSVIAQDVYDALTAKGYRVFFSRITLEDKLGQEYEPYIFAALNSAKIMLAFGTDYEYYNAVWVKNEWSRYLKLMAKDKDKHLIPCYKNIDAYDMPKEFAKLQAQDMGKVGAVQDLLRGIEKILPRETAPAEPQVQERVIVQSVGGPQMDAMLKRGYMALEDSDWEKADKFFEEVLNQNAECAEAYLGKLLANAKKSSFAAWVMQQKQLMSQASTEQLAACSEDTKHIEDAAQKFSIIGYLQPESIRELYSFDRSYSSRVRGLESKQKSVNHILATNRFLTRAEQYAKGETQKKIKDALKEITAASEQYIADAKREDLASIARIKAAYAAHLAQADQKAEQMNKQAQDMRESDYLAAVEKMNSAKTIAGYEDAVVALNAMNGFRDCNSLIVKCGARIAEIREDEKRLEAQKLQEAQKAAEEKAKRKKKAAGIAAALFALIAICFTVCQYVLIPGIRYRNATSLMNEGKQVEAAVLFGRLLNYRDAKERSMELWQQVAIRESISAGGFHTVGLEADGSVVSVGKENNVQCNVGGWTNIVAVSAGKSYTVGLKADGTVVATGDNLDGQCDVGDWKDIIAVSTGVSHTVGLKADGTVVATGGNLDGQCDVGDWKDIIAVSAGLRHSVGLRTDGTVVAVGYNGYGQCNIDDWTDIVALSAGYSHTVGLKSDGTVIAVGSNEYRECDVGNWTEIIAVSAGNSHTVGLKEDGTVIAVGYKEGGRCNVGYWTDIVAISAGYSHTVGLKSDGTVIAVGENYYGQCDVRGWKKIRLPNG